MELFIELEIVYIIIGIFFLIVTAFVTTRGLMPKGSFTKGMIGIFTIFAVMITAHFFVTTKRMEGVKEIFNEGGIIICENKMQKTISRSVLISKELEWTLDGDRFESVNHMRSFHTARCIDYSPIAPKDVPR